MVLVKLFSRMIYQRTYVRTLKYQIKYLLDERSTYVRRLDCLTATYPMWPRPNRTYVRTYVRRVENHSKIFFFEKGTNALFTWPCRSRCVSCLLLRLKYLVLIFLRTYVSAVWAARAYQDRDKSNFTLRTYVPFRKFLSKSALPRPNLRGVQYF